MIINNIYNRRRNDLLLEHPFFLLDAVGTPLFLVGTPPKGVPTGAKKTHLDYQYIKILLDACSNVPTKLKNKHN
jgi:hypothetical protein